MNYELAGNAMRGVNGKIEYSLDVAMPFGEMPPGMLESKFEETDIGLDENAYDDYARGIVCDWTADTNRMEHEEPRNSTGGAGCLQLRYNGHRGDISIDEVYRPEHFDQFIGDEDRDPRGSQVDPDMKQMTRQSMARTRFIRFSPDGSENITGGGRSEARTMADQQTLIRTVRSRLKVFERQLDGRQNGLRREYGHKSAANQTILVQSYGDAITDKGLNPTRRANIIAQSVIGMRKFRDETCDQDMNVAKYTQVRRSAKEAGQNNMQAENDGKFGASEGSKHFKACALLMSDIIRARQQIQMGGDGDFVVSRDAMGRKTAPFAKDLGIILGAMTPDAEFQTSASTLVGKTAARLNRPHLANVTLQQHLTPAHHALNAEIIYKSVKPGADVRKLADQIITDVVRTDADTSRAAKTAKMVMASGAKLARTRDGEATIEFKKTLSYRSNRPVDTLVRNIANDGVAGESDNTQVRRQDHTNYRTATPDDQEQNMRYSDNAQAERHGRGIGKKYMNRYIDRESNDSDHVSDA